MMRHTNKRLNQGCWLMPEISILQRLRQDCQESEVSLGYKDPVSTTTKTKIRRMAQSIKDLQNPHKNTRHGGAQL